MSDHFVRDKEGRCHTIITMANIYEYGGFRFENHHWAGPIKLNHDLEPAKAMGPKFFKAFAEWDKLTKKEKSATQISG